MSEDDFPIYIEHKCESDGCSSTEYVLQQTRPVTYKCCRHGCLGLYNPGIGAELRRPTRKPPDLGLPTTPAAIDVVRDTDVVSVQDVKTGDPPPLRKDVSLVEASNLLLATWGNPRVAKQWAQRLNELCKEQLTSPMPVPMLLWCPECKGRHVDEGEFAQKPHHTHACQHCGHCWRPALVVTRGVQFLPGFKNGGE